MEALGEAAYIFVHSCCQFAIAFVWIVEETTRIFCEAI
jgi:hypothetical protein